MLMGFPGGSVGKEPACNAGDTGGMSSIPGLGRFPWSREQYSFLENPMDRAHTEQYEHNRTSVIICTEPTLELCEMRTLQFHYT